MMKLIYAPLALCTFASLLIAQLTLPVPSAGYPTIQSAINAALSGDTVQVAAGTFFENLTLTEGITLQGAGAGLTIIDGGLADRCLTIILSSSGTATIRHLDIVRGIAAYTDPIRPGVGGGIYFKENPVGISAVLRVEDARVLDCLGTYGSGIGTDFGTDLILERCEFDSNLVSPTTLSLFNGGYGQALYLSGSLVATDCKFTNNDATRPNSTGSVGGYGGAIFTNASDTVTLTRCLFDGNKAHWGGAFVAPTTFNNLLVVNESIFRNNSATAGPGALQVLGSFAATTMQNCLFHDNSSSSQNQIVMSVGGFRVEMLGCTITRNTATLASQFPITLHASNAVTMRNSIISDNGSDFCQVYSGSGGSITIENCLTGASTFNHIIPATKSNLVEGIPAGFVDVANGDFHLLPGSVGVDAGTLPANLALTDLDGLPRNQLNAPDMGCFELQPGQEDPGANWAGTVPDLMGGFDDVLLVNGTVGDSGRRVNTSIGSMSTISVNAAPGTMFGNFVIWGRIGLPGTVEAFPIPFAQGSMAFLPHILGVGNPSFFTLASSSLVGGLFPATQAPWSVTGSSLPFPLTFTLQGLIEAGGTNVRLTNAIVVHNF